MYIIELDILSQKRQSCKFFTHVQMQLRHSRNENTNKHTLIELMKHVCIFAEPHETALREKKHRTKTHFDRDAIFIFELSVDSRLFPLPSTAL
jgi:hypothetical protein